MIEMKPIRHLNSKIFAKWKETLGSLEKATRKQDCQGQSFEKA